LSVPNLSRRELEYISAAVKDGWVSYAGPRVGELETRLAESVEAKQAAVMVSGTAALHIALLLAGVGANDEVVVPALSFIAPANAVRYCGAWPVFVDVAEHDWHIDAEQARDFLETGCRRDCDGSLRNRLTGRRVRALLPVHLLGGMANVDTLACLAEELGLWLIEDAAQAMGARYKGRGLGAPVGTDVEDRRVVCTSFNGNKIMTTGGGGALLANDGTLCARARHLSATARADTREFVHDAVGYNYRMTNLSAALGLAQLEQLPSFVQKKKRIAATYERELETVPGIDPHPSQPDVEATYWLYTVRVAGGSRGLMRSLMAHGIDARPLWKPICGQAPFEGCATHGTIDVSLALWEECLSLPCSTNLSVEQQMQVIRAIRDAPGKHLPKLSER